VKGPKDKVCNTYRQTVTRTHLGASCAQNSLAGLEGRQPGLGRLRKAMINVAINRDSKRMGEGEGKESETKGRDGSDGTYSNSAYDFEHNSDDDM